MPQIQGGRIGYRRKWNPRRMEQQCEIESSVPLRIRLRLPFIDCFRALGWVWMCQIMRAMRGGMNVFCRRWWSAAEWEATAAGCVAAEVAEEVPMAVGEGTTIGRDLTITMVVIARMLITRGWLKQTLTMPFYLEITPNSWKRYFNFLAISCQTHQWLPFWLCSAIRSMEILPRQRSFVEERFWLIQMMQMFYHFMLI